MPNITSYKCCHIAKKSTASYIARLREKSIYCEFDNAEARILEHAMQTVSIDVLVKIYTGRDGDDAHLPRWNTRNIAGEGTQR